MKKNYKVLLFILVVSIAVSAFALAADWQDTPDKDHEYLTASQSEVYGEGTTNISETANLCGQNSSSSSAYLGAKAWVAPMGSGWTQRGTISVPQGSFVLEWVDNNTIGHWRISLYTAGIGTNGVTGNGYVELTYGR